MCTNVEERNKAYVEILKSELIKAMGCTEPIAVAYAGAYARKILGVVPDKIEVGASGSIIKNVKSVIVPNTGHLKGIDVSVAAGVLVGDSDAVLEVLAKVNEEEAHKKILEYIKKTPIKVMPIYYGEVFDIVVKLYSGSDTVTVRIAKYHTNIVLVEKNGKIIEGESIEESLEKIKQSDDSANSTIIDEYKKLLSMDDILDFAKNCDLNKCGELKDLIASQIDCNIKISDEGMKNPYGSNIGKIIYEKSSGSEELECISYAASGSDARMNGCEMAVVINSGSGNQGMTVSIPVIRYARKHNIDDDKLYRALIISNLTSIYEKTPIGTLSAFCGAVTAGAGAGAGIAFLKGYSDKEIKETVSNALGIAAGIVCDGAKASCAGKITLSLSAAFIGMEMAHKNDSFVGGDGIIKDTCDETISAVGRMAKVGMESTNKEIIDIMIQ